MRDVIRQRPPNGLIQRRGPTIQPGDTELIRPNATNHFRTVDLPRDRHANDANQPTPPGGAASGAVSLSV